MDDIVSALSASLLQGVSGVTGLPAEGLRLRLPARGAAAASPLLDTADAGIAAARLTPAAFLPVLGVNPVARVEAKNGWLLFTLSDGFYTAAVRHIQHTLPRPPGDGGSYAVNRMQMLARAGGDDCPRDARVQRALLLTLLSHSGGAAQKRAEAALLSMTRHVPLKDRAAFAAACGGVADAAARILFLS